MHFLQHMHAYFRGEQIEALAFIVPGALVLFLLAGVALKVEGGAFGIGLAAPLILFGLIAGGVGLTVGLRTDGQVAALESEFAASPNAMVAKELPRMRKVNANWPIYLGGYAVFAIVGLGLRFGFKAEWAQGVGPGLVLVAAMGLLIDGFAERRARPYTQALEEVAAAKP